MATASEVSIRPPTVTVVATTFMAAAPTSSRPANPVAAPIAAPIAVCCTPRARSSR